MSIEALILLNIHLNSLYNSLASNLEDGNFLLAFIADYLTVLLDPNPEMHPYVHGKEPERSMLCPSPIDII